VNDPAISIDALRSAVMALPNDALSAVRHAALEHFDEHGLPTTKYEDWKYTDLQSIIEISNLWLAGGAGNSTFAADLNGIDSVCNSIDAHWLIIANGVVDEKSVAAVRDAGVAVSLLSQRAAEIDFDQPMVDLNTALLRDGMHVQIKALSPLEKPIGFLLIDDVQDRSGVTQTRVEIELEKNSEAQFIEYHASSGDAGHFANSIIDMKLDDGARVSMVRIQTRSLHHSQTTRLNAVLQRDSKFDYCGFDLGGMLVRNDLHVEIEGKGATAQFDGLYMADHGQHIDNHTRVDHKVGPARSIQEYRGILAGDCQCVWNGKAIVHAGADGTDAQQQNHNLLLSEKSEIDAKPELEIYADDVKCSHGTTVGQLDEKSIYYIRTRGLNEQFARQILTRAFAGSIANKSPIPALHRLLAEMVDQRLDEIVARGAT
jgi:Fe-S cluster assembly protein SufD